MIKMQMMMTTVMTKTTVAANSSVLFYLTLNFRKIYKPGPSLQNI